MTLATSATAGNTDALLLRSVDYGEADRIVTLLTREYGKASFMARSARRSKKRFGGALQPLSLLRVELQPGKGALGTLVQAQVARSFPHILNDLRRMGAGFAALELVRELSPEHEPDSAVFDAALALVQALDAEPTSPDTLLTCFGLRLLALLGFAPQLERCGLCGRTPGDTQATSFDPREGHLVCQACGGAPLRLGAELRARLRHALGQDWLATCQVMWPVAQIEHGQRTVMAFAEHRIGRPLQAASLLQRPLGSPP